MTIATVTSKGQVTIPADVRKELGLRSGSRIDFVYLDAGRYEIVVATGSVTSLKGLIPAPATPVTLEQMDAAIAEATSSDFSR
jgi:AbrB family looped-hinge helix DNA binding protein